MLHSFENCRLRFAPSPTGYLHIGGARTALFNWLTARKNNGVFILRIEDTDRERYVPGSVEQIMSSLKWLGIDWDEGPDKPGAYGPYIQSSRLDIYKKYCMQLVNQGDAYYCFCAPARLEQMREEQKKRGVSTQYDRTCRNLAADEIARKLENGAQYVIRMKAPLEGAVAFTDLIRDDVVIPHSNIDDQVLLKSDGYPTYHLANVVDDHLMKITDVIRGEEWLMSTAKHLLLYKFFGWEPPNFAHLPLLLNPDKSKLSKRQNDVSVSDYIDKGFLPEAVVNFIALLGWNPGTDRELFTVPELIAAFDIGRCGKSGSVFDIAKLRWMNGMYIRELKKNNINRLSELLKNELLKNKFIDADFSTEKLNQLTLLVAGNIDTISDVSEFTNLLFNDKIEIVSETERALIKSPAASQIKQSLKTELAKIENITTENIQSIMKNIQLSAGIKGKELYHIIRILISGTIEGPDLALLILFLNKSKILARLDSIVI